MNKGLHLYIYRDDLGDCTNGGISSQVKNITVTAFDGPFEPDENAPEFKLVKRFLFGRDYYHLEPVKPCPSNHVGYMMGGNFAYTSDSRFPFDYPLPIHDRSETQEQHDMLSV